MAYEMYKNELEHLNIKLDAAKTLLADAKDKYEIKILKEKVNVLTQQVEIAENNDPDTIREREKIAKEEQAKKEIISAKKAKQREENAKRILIVLGGIAIIGVTLGSCINSYMYAQREATYANESRMLIGLLCILAGIMLFALAPTITKSLLSLIGAIGIGLGGGFMAIGSSVSADAKKGISGWVNKGMIAICLGVIIYVGCFWSFQLKRKKNDAPQAGK